MTRRGQVREGMTSPEDDGLEEALRRALSDAASEIEPGADGLDKIRARIGDRRPRPWLLSVSSASRPGQALDLARALGLAERHSTGCGVGRHARIGRRRSTITMELRDGETSGGSGS